MDENLVNAEADAQFLDQPPRQPRGSLRYADMPRRV